MWPRGGTRSRLAAVHHGNDGVSGKVDVANATVGVVQDLRQCAQQEVPGFAFSIDMCSIPRDCARPAGRPVRTARIRAADSGLGVMALAE